IDLALRRNESLEERLRDPAIGFVNLAPDRHGMHDRKNTRLAKISALDLDVILVQALYRLRRAIEGRGGMRRLNGVDLARLDHTGERLFRRDGADAEFLGQVQRDLLFSSRLEQPAGEIVGARRIDPILVLKNAA